MKIFQRLLIPIALFVSVACGSATSPSGNGPGSGTGSGIGTSGGGNTTSLVATIDGSLFTATTVSATVRNNILAVSGAVGSGADITTLSIATTASVGTQLVVPGTGVNATVQTVAGSTSAGWLASGGQGSGTVSVTVLSTTRASGTFSFTLVPVSGAAAGPKTILAGSFEVPLTQ